MTQPADYSTLKAGSVLAPLAVDTENSLLEDADPALFYLLDFFAWGITAYLGDRLVAAAAGANVKDIETAIAQRYPYNPAPFLTETQFRFPLLAAYHRRSSTGRKTAGWEHDRHTFDVLYVLPTLDAAEAEAVLPILPRIATVLRGLATRGWDPNYQPPGGQLGDMPWALAGVERIGLGDPLRDDVEFAEFGSLPGAGTIWFPCLRLTGYWIERDMPVPAANKFAGGDLTTNLRADDGTRVATSLGGFSSQQAPTITSLSVTTGTQQGGTSVTLTGSLFLDGPPRVRFGKTYAPSVTWTSATSVTVVTPAMQGDGTVDVTLTNRDGQCGVLPQSFTFTAP